MPASSVSGKSFTRYFFNKISKSLTKARILDVGAGGGTYVNHFRPIFPNSIWTAVEVWQPYITKFKLKEIYDSVVHKDIRKVDFVKDFRRINVKKHTFDIAILGDVLEHMTKEEAKEVLSKVSQISRFQIISIPIIKYPQDDIGGNPYERHIKDDWSHEEVVEAFPNILAHVVDREIGVYLLGSPEEQEFITRLFKPKIGVYTIALNEEKFAKRYAQSCRDADVIVVADTGSTDRTVSILLEEDIIVHPIHIKPWRFDVARNAALALVPEDIDICIWLDMDEVLVEGWRQKLESVWKPGTTRLNYMAVWNFKPDGTPDIVFQNNRIHSRIGYKFHRPVHEDLVPDNLIYETILSTEHILTHQHQDTTKNRTQYLPLLRQAVREFPEDAQLSFWLGRELFHSASRES